MTRFSATTRDEAVVGADRMAIWSALTDPVLLPQLTPLLERIDTDGDVWRWHMRSISALGVSIAPSFTEQMNFDEGSRIDYEHAPPSGRPERSGADGFYVLSDARRGTRLQIKLTLHVELPLPRAATPAVQGVMRSTMSRTGDRFSTNLLRHLGVAK